MNGFNLITITIVKKENAICVQVIYDEVKCFTIESEKNLTNQREM